MKNETVNIAICALIRFTPYTVRLNLDLDFKFIFNLFCKKSIS